MLIYNVVYDWVVKHGYVSVVYRKYLRNQLQCVTISEMDAAPLVVTSTSTSATGSYLLSFYEGQS